MSDDEDDPFERLGDVDREGDPFERLGDPDADESASSSSPDGVDGPDPVEDDGVDDSREPSVPDDPFDRLDRDASGTSDAPGPGAGPSEERSSAGPTEGSSGAGSTPGTDPFADLDEPAGDPFSGGDNVFERVDVGEADTDEIWDSITDDGGSEDEEPVVLEDSRHAEVSKHSFCQRCQHFSRPPDAHCTHESAEIIEYLDMERVRLRDCPVVAEREDLE